MIFKTNRQLQTAITIIMEHVNADINFPIQKQEKELRESLLKKYQPKVEEIVKKNFELKQQAYDLLEKNGLQPWNSKPRYCIEKNRIKEFTMKYGPAAAKLKEFKEKNKIITSTDIEVALMFAAQTNNHLEAINHVKKQLGLKLK